MSVDIAALRSIAIGTSSEVQHPVVLVLTLLTLTPADVHR